MATKSKPVHGNASRLGARRRAALGASNEAYAAKRTEIMQAAVWMFAERGYDATTLADIARAVNMDRATLYYYFESKTQLLAFAMTNVLSDTVKKLNVIVVSDDDALTKLRSAVGCILTTMIEDHPFSALNFQDDIWRPPGNAALIAPLRMDGLRIAKAFNSILEDGQHDGSIRDDVPAELINRIVFGSLAWSYRWFKPGCGYDADEVIRSFDAILSSGVAPPKKTRSNRRR
jgi:AcrR family transcriptional regulator